MDKKDISFFAEVRAELEALKSQIAALEGRLSEWEAAGADIVEETAAPDEAIDISIDDDFEIPSPETSSGPESEESPAEEDRPAPEKTEGDVGAAPDPAPVPEPEPEPEPVSEPAPAPRRTVADAALPKGYQWQSDLPGGAVSNVLSAIGLNDRLLFINTLFGEDAALFRSTVDEFNAMSSFDEALAYVTEHFPDWNLSSEPVYRLMMAVRRRLDR